MSGKLERRSPYQGVTAFVGMPGSGKTYSLARVGLEAMERGERVVCNAGFDLAGADVMSSFDDFASLEGPVTVVWDELPLYFNARKFAEFPDAMMYKFTQIRKDGVRLFYSTIHEGMVDVNIRRITFWYWHCHASLFGYHRALMYPPEEIRKSSQRPLRTKWFRIKPEVALAYDTDAKVAVSQKLHDRVTAERGKLGSWAKPEGFPGGPAGADRGQTAAPSPSPADSQDPGVVMWGR